MSLFQHPQLDDLLFSLIDLRTMISLRKVNRYYWLRIRKSRYYRVVLSYLRNNKSLTSTFLEQCAVGDLSLLQWIYYHTYRKSLWRKPRPIRLHAKCGMAFRIACVHGYLEIAQWLYSRDTEFNIMQGFIGACLEGRIKIMEWLITLPEYKETQCIHDLFFILCVVGRLASVQWLYHKINLPDEEIRMAIRGACTYKQLLVVEWFYYELKYIDPGLYTNDALHHLAAKRMMGQLKM